MSGMRFMSDAAAEYIHVWTGVADAVTPCAEITFKGPA